MSENIKGINGQMEKKVQYFTGNLTLLKQKINLFQSVLKTLRENYKNENLSPPFNFIDDILKQFSTQLKLLIEKFDNIVILTLNQIIDELNYKCRESSNISNILQKSLAKEKEIINKKNLFEAEINKGIKNKNHSNEPDFNSFNFSLIENSKQIYDYEIHSIREIIEENQTKYDFLNDEINLSINNNDNINLVLSMFSNQIKNFSKNLEDLSNNINKEIENTTLTKQNPNLLSNQKNDKDKDKIFNQITNQNLPDINFVFDDFKDSNIDEKIIKLIQFIINKTTELKAQDIISIFNFLGININSINNNYYKEIFLSKIFELCQKGVISLKNKKNLFHFANILNTIFFHDKSNLEIMHKIVIVSTRIKYNECYLNELLIKKNVYLKTHTFWKKIIGNNLINKINTFIEENYNVKYEEKESDKKNKEREKNKEQIKKIFKTLKIDKDVSKNIKKFNISQLKDLLKHIQKSTVKLLSEMVTLMVLYSFNDIKLNEFFKYFRDELGISNSAILYLQNIYLIHKFKSTKSNFEIPNKNEVLLLLGSKYISKEEYINIFKLKKALYPNLRKGIFENIFKQQNLSIDLHIKYLGEFLIIKNIKTYGKYNEIKQKIYTYLEQNKNDLNTKKKKNLIQNDLNRTSFIQQNPNHREPIESILFSFYFENNQVKYYQGINTVISFLYQLLNYDEEKTFYYFYAMQFNTDYHSLFEDDFAFLKILFSIFEKTIQIQIPEINYVLKKIKIDIDYFSSSWFITLFFGNFDNIDINNPPLLQIFLIEKFCLNGWCSILNLGIVILELCKEKILSLDKDDLIKYIMNIISEEKIFDNTKFENCKNLFEKNEKFINEFFVDKLTEINKYEYKNNF